jgi:hypothetical protein
MKDRVDKGADKAVMANGSISHPFSGRIVKQTRHGGIAYDPARNTYTKFFTPSAVGRIKHLLKLRKYPGLNFVAIATKLRSLGIGVPEIVSANKFSVTTKALSGRSLFRELLSTNETDVDRYLEGYSSALARTLHAGIFFGDAHFRNYMVCAGTIYALDLDNYRDNLLSPWLARRMRTKLLLDRLPIYTHKLHRKARKSQSAQIIQAVERLVRPEEISRRVQAHLAFLESTK